MKCPGVGIGRQARLRGVCRKVYGFKSHSGYLWIKNKLCVAQLFFWRLLIIQAGLKIIRSLQKNRIWRRLILYFDEDQQGLNEINSHSGYLWIKNKLFVAQLFLKTLNYTSWIENNSESSKKKESEGDWFFILTKTNRDSMKLIPNMGTYE